MTSTRRLVLLLALCGGALLVGVELMITAVALPSIVKDLADWTQLRRASWVVNAYLLTYIATMPLAGRAADRFGLPRLFMAALGAFALGSVLSGASQSLDQLIVARLLQGVGGGAIVPLATAGASQLYRAHSRSRALGLVGACTFLGMALGPFLGATVLDAMNLTAVFAAAGQTHAIAAELLVPSWRWIFYFVAPLAVISLLFVWAAAPDWVEVHTPGSIDAFGAGIFTATIGFVLLALTTLGETSPDLPVDGLGVLLGPPLYVLLTALAGVLAIRHFRRTPHPFIDLGTFRNKVFSSAVIVSLLTGYGLATAIIGSAVFIDRVRYAGADEQRLVLGALAFATAIGALASGFALRLIGVIALGLIGLIGGALGLAIMATLAPATPITTLLAGVILFGAGFGLTVTPRSAAAVEALGRGAAGLASAGVTVARMAGMAVGLAVLTGFGSNRIQALSVVLTDQQARDAVLPPELQGRSLEDGLVVNALERWASGEAASILSGLFLVAAVVMLIAIVPTFAMRVRSLQTDDGGAIIPADGRDTDERDEAARGSVAAF